MRPALIWILVADGQKARFLASEKRNEDLVAAMPDMAVPNPPSREQGTERPGRVHESVGAVRPMNRRRTRIGRESAILPVRSPTRCSKRRVPAPSTS